MKATNENPILESERLASLASWDANWAGLKVVVAGLGVSGFSAADTLIELGARVLVVDGKDDAGNRDKEQTLRIIGAADVLLGEGAMDALPTVDGEKADLVITSPGLRPTLGVLADAAAQGVQIWGDVELAWRLRERAGRTTAPWLCITGTNGKTTTVGMLESILQTAGHKAIAVGNVGTPILDALRDPVDYDFFAVELSSFQLHWTHSMSPLASVVLNVAEDHVDWHEGYDNYLADKARIYENTQVACVFNADAPETITMVEEADVIEGARAIGFWANTPSVSMLGVIDGLLVDRAFLDDRKTQALEIGAVEDTGQLPTRHTVENALAASALARAAGVSPDQIREGLRAFEPGDHRIQLVANTHGVLWVNDSKATNPHAANASLASFKPVIWIAGGLSKGVEYDQLVKDHAQRLKAVIAIGTDHDGLLAALKTHAPEVPVYNITQSARETGIDITDGSWAMQQAIAKAHELSEQDDTVLMAPAAASMDQFVSYADRGNAFIDAVANLVEEINGQ
ncbi:UDP-N-acetylmuramoyl-L-alanine--D-glutamate ligase [Rothia sp. ZJ932]|uniref:UDP-N-acetylmuramoyl-L-alanine--D-glutamate ligase n=1 Tax=Rothia sp. ZJ932 TaxID=2810516 RepID=UPI00196724B2|nr:UDP-N-acetylmuramoyl-L-alanine--D-glutamate ligase [Rothia sp. ZJ932]QRZ60938.1 UDP-N-acetylmuramoyl-L-alanine--D-glutamate ligase [Rothia sp. ZJ932]